MGVDAMGALGTGIRRGALRPPMGSMRTIGNAERNSKPRVRPAALYAMLQAGRPEKQLVPQTHTFTNGGPRNDVPAKKTRRSGSTAF
jgi:hypothetical protein